MSGLGNNSPQGGNFLKMKEGKFYLSSDKANENPYGELEGVLTGIEYKEETYDGAKVMKVYFNVSTKQGVFKFNVGLQSGQYGRLISFLKSADITKELTFVTIADEPVAGKTPTSILVQQNGAYMKSFFTKDGPNVLPKWNKVKFNGQDVWDKTAYLESLEAVVGELNVTLNKNNNVPVTQSTPQSQSTPVAKAINTAAGTVTKAVVQPAVAQEDPDDSLPF